MSCGGGRAGAGGGSGQKATLATARVHPRYVPRRGAVLKRIASCALRFFLSPVNGAAPVASGRVRPAPADSLGDDGAAEQGK